MKEPFVIEIIPKKLFLGDNLAAILFPINKYVVTVFRSKKTQGVKPSLILDVRHDRGGPSSSHSLFCKQTLDYSTERIIPVKRVPMSEDGTFTDLFHILPICFNAIDTVWSTTSTSAPTHLCGGAVIICCDTGCNQSVVVALAYMVIVEGYNLSNAVFVLKDRFSKIPQTSSINNKTPELCPSVCYLGKLIEIEECFHTLFSPSYRCIWEIVEDLYGYTEKRPNGERGTRGSIQSAPSCLSSTPAMKKKAQSTQSKSNNRTNRNKQQQQQARKTEGDLPMVTTSSPSPINETHQRGRLLDRAYDIVSGIERRKRTTTTTRDKQRSKAIARRTPTPFALLPTPEEENNVCCFSSTTQQQCSNDDPGIRPQQGLDILDAEVDTENDDGLSEQSLL